MAQRPPASPDGPGPVESGARSGSPGARSGSPSGAQSGSPGARRGRLPVKLQITGSDIRGALWSLVTTGAGLGLAIAVVPGVTVTNVWSVVLAAVVVSAGDVLARPFLRVVALRLGVVGALVFGVAAQVFVAWLALTFLPGIETKTWADAVYILLIAGAFMALGRWIVGANDSEYVLGALLRRARRARRRDGSQTAAQLSDELPAGMVIVQLDGVARSTLDYALQAGLAPNLARWLGMGTHRLETWWARVPATTPASQAGLLHGTSDHVPAFRWWDRELGRLVVTNKPVDAARVEELSSNGAGLLAGGGVAVSTMFSGDAATSLLVMSRARQGLGPGQMFVHFFSSPFVLVRALIGTVGEFFKELYQGWQQATRGVRPRVSRLGAYPILRATSNVMLRDLNTSLVAEQITKGVPIVFVDLVDYDEIAHHAGPLRPESLRSLEGLDRVIGLWEQVAATSPRKYEFVVLSDHGQSLGATFQQVIGRSFRDEVRRLMALPTPTTDRRSPDADTEEWGSVNTALNAFTRSADPKVIVGPDLAGEPGGADPQVAVVGSGNLGMIWFPSFDRRLTESEIQEHWPALLPGLLANPVVGLVVTCEGRDVVARSVRGSINLVSGEVEGADPLEPFGPQARLDLLRVSGLANAGDVVLISTVDDVGMVHAFEGLVGSHGGLGGAQNEAILLYPAQLRIPDAERETIRGNRMIVGAEGIHLRLVAWLEELGIREIGLGSRLPDPPQTPQSVVQESEGVQ